MPSKRNGALAAVIQLVVVACMGLAIAGGVVAWMAAREGTSLGELMSDLLIRRQSARPVLARAISFPTYTPQPSPTPAPAMAASTQAPLPETAPTLSPTDGSPANEPPPTVPASSPLPAPTSQLEQGIESPIRAGSPLPERPATRLVIPAMGLDVPVILSPIVNRTWQVDHLGKDFVGHLEGTASPGDPSNVVLAGHVTLAHNVYGPFAGLGKLQPGDTIIVYVGDQPYTYRVDYRQLVDRTDVQVAYPTDGARLTLITCSNWSDELRAYQQRLIVVGHLVG
jgi:LPXTG-site transpeptidase (sortase) family protein